MALLEFFSRGEYPPSNINIFYIGILIIYAFHKEALRFLEHSKSKKGQKGGELFVYLWLIMPAFLYLINFLSKNFYSYSIDGEKLQTLTSISITALEVGAIFLLTRILKLAIIRLFSKK